MGKAGGFVILVYISWFLYLGVCIVGDEGSYGYISYINYINLIVILIKLLFVVGRVRFISKLIEYKVIF